MSTAIDDSDAEHKLARRAIIATNRYERFFARWLVMPHASSSCASWRRNDRIDRR